MGHGNFIPRCFTWRRPWRWNSSKAWHDTWGMNRRSEWVNGFRGDWRSWKKTGSVLSFILLMEEILHQLICTISRYLYIYIIVSYIPGGAGFQPWTVSWQSSWWLNNPSEKYLSNWIISPGFRVEECLKPPSSSSLHPKDLYTIECLGYRFCSKKTEDSWVMVTKCIITIPFLVL